MKDSLSRISEIQPPAQRPARLSRVDETESLHHVHDSTKRTAERLPTLLTLQEVSDVLRLNPRTVRRLVATRRMPCVRLGRHLRFDPRDVSRFVAARKE